MNTLYLTAVDTRTEQQQALYAADPIYGDMRHVPASVESEPDTTKWAEQGRADYERGVYWPPKGAADHMEYIRAWNDTWAAKAGRKLLR